jgi:MFS family permease
MSQADIQSAEYSYSKKQIFWGVVAIFAVYGTMSFSVQTIGIARPKITADLNGLPLYALSMSIPMLVMALVTIIFGKFSDMYGRRIMLMIALISSFIGTILSAVSPNFIFMIVATAIAALGVGAMMPLVFAVVGDLFPPSQRSKWVGLLNIPLGVFTLIGPSLGGYVVDTLNWRYLYWFTIPLLVVCLLTVPMGVPSLKNRDSSRKIDVMGCVLVALAAATTIIGFSKTSTYSWGSMSVLRLLGFSLLCWIIFFWVESRAKEPILDLAVLRNRSFRAVALATFFSSFGTMGMLMYFPMYLQGVKNISTTFSGFITTPYGFLTAFMGVPAGYIIARYNRFKWMYVVGYGILTLSMFGLILFDTNTGIVWSISIALLAGLGYGVIPTINTVVVQNAVPKRLMGVAMGAIFFFLMMGSAIAPAILGSTMNVTYTEALSQSLPEGLRAVEDEKTISALDNPQVLLSEKAMENLKHAFEQKGPNGPQLFQQTVAATRHSLQAAIHKIFRISAVLMLLAFLIICTVPQKTVHNEE